VTLARKLTLLFAGAAVLVAPAVGALGYAATASGLRQEVERSLTQAVRTMAEGGIPDGLPAIGQSRLPVGQSQPPVGSPPTGTPPPPLLSIQYVDAAGRISLIGGRRSNLPVDARDLAIAASCARGAGQQAKPQADPQPSSQASSQANAQASAQAIAQTSAQANSPAGAQGQPRNGAQDLTRFRDVVIQGAPYTMLTECAPPAGGGRPGQAIQVAHYAQDSRNVLAMLANRMLAIGLGVVVAAALTGRLVAWQLTRRLAHLTAIAEQVSSTGRLDLAVPARGRDEVGRLGVAFDGMLGQLARSKDDQQRLVQDAGHELRTPLTSIRMNVSLLRRFDELTVRARREVLDDLTDETRELSNLINEIVELASDRRTDEVLRPVALAPLLEAVADRVRRRTGRAVAVDADSSTVLGRPAALERAISNLIDNATKFDRGGRAPIEVSLRLGRVEVRDRGPGIPAEDLDRIFDRFHRAAAARSLPGSGLGLSIVQDVAAAHRGRVFAANRDGGGAVIGFTVAPIHTLV
jgi:signal transduction histidine kinase